MSGNSTEHAAGRKVLPTRIFALRGGRRLVCNIVYHKASGKRPHALGVLSRQAKATSLTLKNKDFFAQYKRAVDAIADSMGIPSESPVRSEMEATATDFLAHYGLETQPIEVGEGANKVSVKNVVVEPADDGSRAASEPSQRALSTNHPAAFHSDGRVRGVTYKARHGAAPAQIHVRPRRGKLASFSLENTSFATQYAAAIAHLADALGLPRGDPLRTRMECSGDAFLRYYGLTTRPLSIDDVVAPLSDL